MYARFCPKEPFWSKSQLLDALPPKERCCSVEIEVAVVTFLLDIDI